MLKLSKEDIIEQTNAFPFSMLEYTIIGGASLVLNNYLQYTDDIDITMTEEAFEKIKALNVEPEKRVDGKEAYRVGVFHIFKEVYVKRKKAINKICYKTYEANELNLKKIK